MSNVGRPVGPLPTGVYWRRRILVIAAITAVVVLVRTFILAGDDGSSPAPVSSEPTMGATPTRSAEPTAVAPTTAALQGGCDPADVAVELAVDPEPFATGLAPVFTVTTRNDGPAACGVDAGSGQLEVVVTQDEAPVWSSNACEGTGVARVVQLEPTAADVTEVSWPTQFAAGEECPGQSAAAAGTYSAVATMGGVSSNPVDVQLD